MCYCIHCWGRGGGGLANRKIYYVCRVHNHDILLCVLGNTYTDAGNRLVCVEGGGGGGGRLSDMAAIITQENTVA